MSENNGVLDIRALFRFMYSLRFPLILLALLTAIALLATPISIFIAPLEYTGNLNYVYNEGTNPIIKIDFQFDQEIAESLVVVNAPSPWNWIQSGNILSMTGGNLAPGNSLIVSVSFNKYVLPGDRPYTGIGTTSGGESITSLGVLAVTEMITLKIIYILNQNQLYLIGGTIALLITETIRRWNQKRPQTPFKPKPIDAEEVLQGDTELKLPIPITETGLTPRKIPPPEMSGKKIDVDPKFPPVYVVSDFHLGSNKQFGKKSQKEKENKSIDKRKSNDMDYDTLKVFLEWLDSVDLDATNYDHYDVVMNGDFIDLWQAKRPKGDTNVNRLEDILDSNNLFFSELVTILRRRFPRCRFYYLIGNHDDALFPSKDKSHNKVRQSLTKHLMSTKPKYKLMSFKIDTHYYKEIYKLYIEHGHRFDSFNWKGLERKAVGQKIAEFVNRMQEMDPTFENCEYTPNQEFVKHLACLIENEKPKKKKFYYGRRKRRSSTMEKTPKKIIEIIDDFKKLGLESSFENSWLGTLAELPDYVLRRGWDGMRPVIDHEQVDPKKVRKNNREKAKAIIEKRDKEAKNLPDWLLPIKTQREVKIVVLAHTHFRDLRPGSGESDWASANTGTWLREIIASKDSKKCRLETKPSPLPYVKISKEDGEDKALVELKYFRGNLEHGMVKVRL